MNQNVANYASFVNEDLLRKCVVVLFPGEKVIVNAQREHDFRYADTGKPMEFDLWFPELDLCFEFQDSYHYVTTWYKPRTLTKIRQKDNEKQAILLQNEISLIPIPCWWDGTTESLASTINFQRPDLLSEGAELIPLNPALNYFLMPEMPHIRELMLASFADENFSPSPYEWWMGEKYDGVRCYWDSLTQSGYTRHGRELDSLLPIFTDKMPKISIDCELWYGRGQYSFCSELVSRHAPTYWDFLRMVIFDVVPILTLEIPFEDRYARMLREIRIDHPFSIPAFRVLCQGDLHVKEFADDVIQKGGEGIIFRKIASYYQIGRSLSLVKMKTSLGDKEAMVVGVEFDGSLDLKLPNGKTFLVPKKDVHVTKPSIGDIVSFSYDENSRLDLPNHPSVFRIRTDMVWDDVIASSRTEKKGSEVFKTKPLHYWTEGNVRMHLEKAAKAMNLDPLLASTWHTLSAEKLAEFEGGTSIRYAFKGGFLKNVQARFPEVDFQFDTGLSEISGAKLRREFFVNYAKKQSFDPLVPENWYSQIAAHVAEEKGGNLVLSYYDYKLRSALIALFPEIGLDESRFKIQGQWKDENKRRAVFLDFAKANGFDPLHADNWAKISGRRFIKFSTNANTILKTYYQSSFTKAVLALFPDIGFPQYAKANSWTDYKARRSFFEKYAKNRNFDPLNPENWYSQKLLQITSEKGAFGVLSHHNNDFRRALVDLFPEIELKYERFSTFKLPKRGPSKKRRPSMQQKLARLVP